MVELALTNSSRIALIDDCDADRVLVLRWHWHERYVSGGGGVKLHRFIMGEPDALVDHRDRNRLNNRRENLRLCTHTENARNRSATRGRERLKGVYQNKSGSWGAQIRAGEFVHYGTKRLRRIVSLGTYPTAREAAEAYDRAALTFYGEFAALNYPKEKP